MLNYFIKRLLGLIPTLLIVAVLVFGFVHLLPVQFWRFLTHVAQADFGTSMYRSGR